MIGLQAYYPLHVRWKLKDGREFILEDIDVRAIMREYFKTNDIKLPWQREGRTKLESSDFDPLLTHAVKDDSLIIKWVIRTNSTPIAQRFLPSGAATKWDTSNEEYLVIAIPGRLTSGIDFNKTYESRK